MARLLPFCCLVALCLLLCGCSSAAPVWQPVPDWPPQATFSASRAAGDDTLLTLGWNPVTDTNVTSYRVYTGTSSRSYAGYTTVPVTLTMLSFTNLPTGQAYYFAVTARNAVGLESLFSNEVQWPPLKIVKVASVYSTNLGGAVIATNWSITLTNPPGNRFYWHTIE
jgi:hypothetical protein